MLTSVKNKLRRLLAMAISVFLVAGVVMPVEAQAQETPNDPIPLAEYLEDTYSYAYGGLLDLRLLNQWLTVGEGGPALTATDLRGVDQKWVNSGNNNQDPVYTPLDLSLLEDTIYLDLGELLKIPLLGEDALLGFVLGDAEVGALHEYASAPFSTQAHGAAGVVSDSGGIELTQPGQGANANIDLLSLLNLRDSTLITEDIISAAALELGAVSAVATKPDTSALDENASVTCDPNLTLLDYNALKSRQIHSGDLSGDDEVLQEEDGRICSGYQVADAQVVVDAPGVGTLVTALTALLGGVESTLNGLLEGGGLLERLKELPLLGAVLRLLGKVEAEVHLPVTEITDALIVDPLEDSKRLVSIDLSTGQISVDLKQLHAGNLNDLKPNSSLLTPAELEQITDAVTNLLTASKEEEPKGLNARLDKLLRGEEKQGGLYATEVRIDVCVLPLAGPCLVDAEISATLGGLLNPTVWEANTIAQYEAEPYNYYYVDGLLALFPNQVIRLLGGIGTVVEGLLFGEGTGLLGGLLGDLQKQVISPLLDTLTPVLEGVLDPIANIIINRQTLQEVEHGTVFTVSALEVNVLELGTQGELLHLPLATASVMAQPPVTMDFDVAKVGDGRNLYTDDYTYDLVCTLGEGENEREVVNKTGPEESIVYAATKVGDGFVYGQADPDEPPKLSLTGATGGLTKPIRISPGAECTVTGTADTLTTLYPALPPTGDGEGTRTPYTYFLDVDFDEDGAKDVLISGATPTDGPTEMTPLLMTGSGQVTPDTDTVGDEWKNHTFTFEVPAGRKIHRISIVHAYDIDTRGISLTKDVVGTVPEKETFTFEYSLDGGENWLPQDPLTVAPGDDPVTIGDVPVLDLAKLNADPSVVAPTEIMIREVLGSNADAQYVTWKVEDNDLAGTYATDGTFQYAVATFEAGPVEDAATVLTPVMKVGVTNSYLEVSVDKHIDGLLSAPGSDTAIVTATVTKTDGDRTLSATDTDKHGAMRLSDLIGMLPETGARTLVWVLGLGLLVALAALVNYVRNRRN